MDETLIKFDINKAIGLRVKAYRKNNRLTQEKMAELIGVSPNYITILENGKGGMSIETLIKITRICGITPNDLLQDFIPNYEIISLYTELKQRISKLSVAEMNLICKLVEGLEENRGLYK